MPSREQKGLALHIIAVVNQLVTSPALPVDWVASMTSSQPERYDIGREMSR